MKVGVGVRGGGGEGIGGGVLIGVFGYIDTCMQLLS